MPNTLLKNPVRVDVASTAIGLRVAGIAASAVVGDGVQPAETLTVAGTTGQETTGTGQTAGIGADVSITGGTGGAAPSGSTNGSGGTVTINPGPPGAGAGGAASHGKVLLATDGGNVGVGTTTPDISGIGTSATTLTLAKTSGGRGNLELATDTDADGTSIGTVTFTNATQSTTTKRVAEIRGLEEGTTSHNRGGRLTFGTRADGATDVTTRFIIDQAGNVALGPYTPAFDLDIIRTESGARTDVRVSNNSNTSNSRAFFDIHVAGSSAGSPVLNFGVSGVGSWSSGLDNTDGQKFKINWSGATSANDNFSGTNVLTILTSGKVGIGTTSPGSTLHVNGGVQVGAPTGGDKGTGNINIAGDIYKNGAPLLAKLEKAYSQIAELTKRLGRLDGRAARPSARKGAAPTKKTAKKKAAAKKKKGNR
jgi:hypothetical protein